MNYFACRNVSCFIPDRSMQQKLPRSMAAGSTLTELRSVIPLIVKAAVTSTCRSSECSCVASQVFWNQTRSVKFRHGGKTASEEGLKLQLQEALKLVKIALQDVSPFTHRLPTWHSLMQGLHLLSKVCTMASGMLWLDQRSPWEH